MKPRENYNLKEGIMFNWLLISFFHFSSVSVLNIQCFCTYTVFLLFTWQCFTLYYIWHSGGDHGFDLDKTMKDTDKDHAVILMAHQPNAAKAALDSKYDFSLILSGMF